MAAVSLLGGELKDWRMWSGGKQLEANARSSLRILVASFNADIVVTESPFGPTAKTGRSLRILRTLTQAAEDEPIEHFRITRVQAYRNRYEEARVLANRFPPISGFCPVELKSYENEPRNLLYFEALSFAVTALDR